jgi:hypothetical protein
MLSRSRLRYAREAARNFLRTARHRCLQRTRHWWVTHRELLAINNGYAAAVAALAAALATHATAKDIIAALAAGILAIHSALRRDITSY